MPGPVFGHTTLNYNSTLAGSMFEFWCQRINGTLLAVCLNNGEWSPKPSDNMLCSTPGGMNYDSYIYRSIILAVTIFVSLLPDLLTSHNTGCIASPARGNYAGDAIHPVLWEVSRSGNSETIYNNKDCNFYDFIQGLKEKILVPCLG